MLLTSFSYSVSVFLFFSLSFSCALIQFFPSCLFICTLLYLHRFLFCFEQKACTCSFYIYYQTPNIVNTMQSVLSLVFLCLCSCCLCLLASLCSLPVSHCWCFSVKITRSGAVRVHVPRASCTGWMGWLRWARWAGFLCGPRQTLWFIQLKAEEHDPQWPQRESCTWV